jgi:hypothetical protein
LLCFALTASLARPQDFVWFGPIVGPLNKADFLETGADPVLDPLAWPSL